MDTARNPHEAAILAELDRAAQQAESWPIFFCAEPDRAYHAMKLSVVLSRTTDAWALLFECIEGSSPPRLQVNRYRIDSRGESGRLRGIGRVSLEATPRDLELDDADGLPLSECYASGPAGMVALDADRLAALEPERTTSRGVEDRRWTLLLRAYLAAYPDAYWGSPDDIVGTSLLDDGEVWLTSTAFEHVVGPLDPELDPTGVDRQWAILPSESSVYRSLARAIAHRDAARFEPGESNLDWRLHLGPAEPTRQGDSAGCPNGEPASFGRD